MCALAEGVPFSRTCYSTAESGQDIVSSTRATRAFLKGPLSFIVRCLTMRRRATQLENLETKIEHLVNALSSKQAQQNGSMNVGRPISSRSPPSDQTSPLTQPSERSNTQGSYADTSLSPTITSTTSPNDVAMVNINDTELCPRIRGADVVSQQPLQSMQQALNISLTEAEALLRRYQRLLAQNMPFVKLRPDTSVQQLWLDKPLLLHAIVTVAHYHDLPRQQAMVKNLIRDISERLLINSEKTIGNLQGILVFINWYHCHIFWAGQLTNLLHLAMALTVDLAIDRSPAMLDHLKPAALKNANERCHNNRAPTLEDHRALAGTYYMSATMSASFKKLEAMKYSKYLDDVLSTLQHKKEYDSDLHLVQICRLQHFMDDALGNEMTSVPTSVQIRAFQAELSQLRNTDPCPSANNKPLRMQYLTAEIAVWEVALSDVLDNKAKVLRPHLESLHQCIQSIKALIDVFFAISAPMYWTIAHASFGHFAHCLIILFKLVNLDIDGWDFKDFNELLDFRRVCDEAAQRYDESTTLGPEGEDLNNDTFTKWSFRLRWMKQMCDAKYAPEDGAEATKTAAVGGQSAVATPGVQQPTPPDDVLSGDFFNYLDDNFWQSFAGEVDTGFMDQPMMPFWRMS